MMNHQRSPLMGAVVLGCLLLFATVSSYAQEPKIYLDIDDLNAEPGELVYVSVFIENLPDSIVAYQLGMNLDRPDIMGFRTLLDQTGTLTEDWSGSIQLLGEFSEQITSSAGFPPNRTPIPPNTSGVLIKFAVELFCEIPDTMQDRTVQIVISPVLTSFSTPEGSTIAPLDFTPGSVTAGLRCPHQGDIEPDGFITALDLAGLISILFEGGASPQDPCCPTFRFDFDCDGFVTALDLSVIIDHLFAGGSEPCTP